MSTKFTMLFAFIALFSFSTISAQDLPAPSPLGKVEQVVGLTDVAITYSRPSVKGRTIFGELLPFGTLWRTGANSATKISFSTPVTVMGNKLAAGEYAIFTIPGETEWTVIFNKNVNQGGTGSYSEDLDAARLTIAAKQSEFTETLTFNIADVKDNGATIELTWEKTTISIPFTVSFTEIAQTNIDNELKKLEGTYAVYNKIARYYVDQNIELAKALTYAKKSVELEKKFWNVYTLSLAQAANKNYKEAVKTAEMSKALAVEAKYDVYIKMNSDNIAKWSKMK